MTESKLPTRFLTDNRRNIINNNVRCANDGCEWDTDEIYLDSCFDHPGKMFVFSK